jgi:hypothetical protein
MLADRVGVSIRISWSYPSTTCWTRAETSFVVVSLVLIEPSGDAE